MINILLAYVVFMICRLVFLWENASLFNGLQIGHLMELCKGGIYFDTSAIMYANALIILLYLLPLHWKETHRYHAVVRWIYVVINTLRTSRILADALCLHW